MTVPEPSARTYLSLHETNEIFPDHDFTSTWDNSEAFGIPADANAWSLEAVPVPLIDPRQLLDDPDDIEGVKKIESIRRSLRSKDRLIPPVYVLRYEEREHPYCLIEGKHRYNAAHREKSAEITAWVGHQECCRCSRSANDKSE